MPYTINTAQATILDSNGQSHRIDVFSGDVEEAQQIAINEITVTKEEAKAELETIANNVNTATSNQVTDVSAVANMIAQHFNQNNTYKSGNYVRYTITSNNTPINKLYRLTADHAAGVTWENTSKIEINIGNDISDLKSAIEYNYYRLTNWEQGSIANSSGDNIDTGSAAQNYCRTPGYYDISALIGFTKPTGIQIYVYYYDNTKTYIKRVGWGMTHEYIETHAGVAAEVPTAKYIRITTTIGNTTTNPDDVDASEMIISMIVNAENNPLFGKRLAVHGDSICYGVGYAGGYAGIIGNNNGMLVTNYAVSGASIASNVHNNNGTVRYCISTDIENMSTEADYIILEGGVNDSYTPNSPYSRPEMGEMTGGYNDSYDTDTFIGACEYMFKMLTSRFSGKKIGFIITHGVRARFSYLSNGINESANYYYALKKCANKWGVPVLDLQLFCPPFGLLNSSGGYTDMVNTYTHNGDGTHPSEAGYRKYYVPKIEAWMKTL